MRILAAIAIIVVLGFLAFRYFHFKGDGRGFYFGASNAAFQVEGSPADSDWREWTLGSYPDGTPHISELTNAER